MNEGPVPYLTQVDEFLIACYFNFPSLFHYKRTPLQLIPGTKVFGEIFLCFINLETTKLSDHTGTVGPGTYRYRVRRPFNSQNFLKKFGKIWFDNTVIPATYLWFKQRMCHIFKLKTPMHP
jgi:hypothetical protein